MLIELHLRLILSFPSLDPTGSGSMLRESVVAPASWISDCGTPPTGQTGNKGEKRREKKRLKRVDPPPLYNSPFPRGGGRLQYENAQMYVSRL